MAALGVPLGGRDLPDPVSVEFEDRAARLLARVYAANGGWVVTRLADPPRSLAARWRAEGIDVTGPDDQKGGEMRTRWARGFTRAVYRLHRWHYRERTHSLGPRRTTPSPKPIEVEVGRHLPAVGVIPPGRNIRVRMLTGGQVSRRAVRRLPDSDRIYNDAGQPAGRWHEPSSRDWLPA